MRRKDSAGIWKRILTCVLWMVSVREQVVWGLTSSFQRRGMDLYLTVVQVNSGVRDSGEVGPRLSVLISF